MRIARPKCVIWAGLSALAAITTISASRAAHAQDPGAGAGKLSGKTVAILVSDGFEQVELTGPRQALDQAEAKTVVVSPHGGQVRAWNLTNWGDMFHVNLTLDEAKPEQFDALLLPGGVMNPDMLRLNGEAVKFVKAFFEAGKPVAAICHAPWTLIEADVVRGRKMTSWPSLRTDLKNAGATWVDSEAVTDNGLVTSRRPSDIPAFNRHTIDLFAEGKRPAVSSTSAPR